MRVRTLLPLAAALALAAPAAAQAAFPHVVSSGESLYSVAAADGLSVAQLAAANGVSPDSQLLAGSTLLIPPQTVAPAGIGASTTAGDGDGDADDVGATSTAT